MVPKKLILHKTRKNVHYFTTNVYCYCYKTDLYFINTHEKHANALTIEACLLLRNILQQFLRATGKRLGFEPPKNSEFFHQF